MNQRPMQCSDEYYVKEFGHKVKDLVETIIELFPCDEEEVLGETDGDDYKEDFDWLEYIDGLTEKGECIWE